MFWQTFANTFLTLTPTNIRQLSFRRTGSGPHTYSRTLKGRLLDLQTTAFPVRGRQTDEVKCGPEL